MLNHITLNTGHISSITSDEIDSGSIEMLRPLVRAGKGQVPGRPGFHFEISVTPEEYAGNFTISHGKTLLTINFLCFDARGSAALWEAAVGFSPLAAILLPDGYRPESPWLATALMDSFLPTMMEVCPNDFYWIGRFEGELGVALFLSGDVKLGGNAKTAATTNCPSCNRAIAVGTSPCPGCDTILDWG